MKIASNRVEMVAQLSRRSVCITFVILPVLVLSLMPISACRKSVRTAKGSEPHSATVSQTSKGPDLSKDEQSCKEFVQGVYDWYVFRMLDDDCKKEKRMKEKDLDNSCRNAARFHAVPAISLKKVLSPDLKKLEDKEQAMMTKEGDAGLDFDEYLNSQDPSSKYEVRAFAPTRDIATQS